MSTMNTIKKDEAANHIVKKDESTNDIVKTDELPTAPSDDELSQYNPEVFHGHVLKQAYPDPDRFDTVLQFHESWLKAEFDAYAHKVKLLEPIFKERSEFIKKIPGFWLAVFSKDIHCLHHIDPVDLDVLTHLEDFTVQHDPKDPRNVTFNFHFAKANPYFSDRILTKKFTVIPANKDPKAPPKLIEMNEKYELERRCESTPVTINWTSDEHNLVKKRPVCTPEQFEQQDEDFSMDEAYGSFFNFFSFVEDRFELHSILLELHNKALDIYAGYQNDADVGLHERATEDEYEESEDEDEEDGDPNEVVDLEESESNDEPKKKRARTLS